MKDFIKVFVTYEDLVNGAPVTKTVEVYVHKDQVIAIVKDGNNYKLKLKEDFASKFNRNKDVFFVEFKPTEKDLSDL